MRLIDADALTEKAYWHGEHPDVGNPFAEGVEAVDMSDIDNAPTIEAEPVRHGRWEGTADGYWNGELVYDIWNCSECGFDADGADEKPDWNYCPNCGAKMDGDSNE